MYPSVKKVVAEKDYILYVYFDNGESGTLDMKPFLDFGVFSKLKDYAVFKRVYVSFDTIEWDLGVDLDPEFVYANTQKLGNEQYRKLPDRNPTKAL